MSEILDDTEKHIALGEVPDIFMPTFLDSVAEHAHTMISVSPGSLVDLSMPGSQERISTDDILAIEPDKEVGNRLKIIIATSAGAMAVGFCAYEVFKAISKMRPKGNSSKG